MIDPTKIRYGDRIVIGGYNNNKPMTFTKCSFSYDNGLYETEVFTTGVKFDDNDTNMGDESLYHLFGNDLDEQRTDIIWFYSCTDEEHKQEVDRIQNEEDEEVREFFKYYFRD